MNNLRFKDDVRVHPEGIHALPWCLTPVVYAAIHTRPTMVGDCVVVTSINDSQHQNGSLHYRNKAVDIRVMSSDRSMMGNIAEFSTRAKEVADRWVSRIYNHLSNPQDYDILVSEGITAGGIEYYWIHAEYDPKEV